MIESAWVRRGYSVLALALSSVTAVSIFLAVLNLIEGRFIAALFASAAVGLDLFKYLSWPLALRLFFARKWLIAALLAACAITLAGISGWATYDRMSSSIAGSNASVRAQKGERVTLLRETIAADQQRLLASAPTMDISRSVAQQLVLQELHKQAAALRARGMPSKASEFESGVIAAAESRLVDLQAEEREAFNSATQRDQVEKSEARARIDRNGREIVEIQGLVEKGAAVPAFIVTLICAGFALALEILPSLILVALASLPITEQAPSETSVSSDDGLVTEAGVGLEDQLLLRRLIEHVEQLEAGESVRVKDFSLRERVGTMRACRLFQRVSELGLIEKTGNGYKKALQAKQKPVASPDAHLYANS